MVRKIAIYADGADLNAMKALAYEVSGFTTNPSLCKKSGVTDYKRFAQDALAIANGKPISLEVLTDDMVDMEGQAREISSWGQNIYVKIPVTNTSGESATGLIELLLKSGIKVNVTAVMTREQIRATVESMDGRDGIVSIFAGRIADSGKDPSKYIRYAANLKNGRTRILWASTREVYNVVQAEESGCDIITCSPSILGKIGRLGQNLAERSLETVKEFFEDAKGLSL